MTEVARTPTVDADVESSTGPRSGGRPGRSVRRFAQWGLTAAYPLTILSAWHWHAPRYIGLCLISLLWLQRYLGRGILSASLRRFSPVDWGVAGVLSCASIAIVWTNSATLLRLYPVFVNLGLLLAFGATVIRGPSMIEKFARMHNPQLGSEGVRYTRRVTMIWCAFFVANGLFSLYTALRWSDFAWALYNGAIVYGPIGALIVGEMGWRHWIVRPRLARQEAA
jgi:uncharacterized membrane protein